MLIAESNEMLQCLVKKMKVKEVERSRVLTVRKEDIKHLAEVYMFGEAMEAMSSLNFLSMFYSEAKGP